ncbi:novel plant SNARE 12-like [Henckelia pumila]|uniref:novel plant SNARE 12-like n=1 Tax=Henckelia pumila TaxID=405737 RepID=UPI003C6E9A2B
MAKRDEELKEIRSISLPICSFDFFEYLLHFSTLCGYVCVSFDHSYLDGISTVLAVSRDRILIGIVKLGAEMSNQELIDAGTQRMDETDQAIERSKQVVHQTIKVRTQTATTLKGQNEQRGCIVNELDTIQFFIKKASQLVKEINCSLAFQVASDKCIMLFLFLIVCGVIAIIVVKTIVGPADDKDRRNVNGSSM